MNPVSFITSRMLVKEPGGKEFQGREESAHLILRFAGKRSAAPATAAGSNESDAMKQLRLIVVPSYRSDSRVRSPGCEGFHRLYLQNPRFHTLTYLTALGTSAQVLDFVSATRPQMISCL
jgi:hypothetical protein